MHTKLKDGNPLSFRMTRGNGLELNYDNAYHKQFLLKNDYFTNL